MRRKMLLYRRISQMTYRPKSAGKTEDFETWILCTSLNSSKLNGYLFFKGLGYSLKGLGYSLKALSYSLKGLG